MTMKKVTFDYSLKNIPVPSKDTFLKCLIDKTQKFFQRVRWKVFWEVNKDKVPKFKETYGFNTEKSAPAHSELAKFESDVINLIHNLEYRTNKTQFQKKLLINNVELIVLPSSPETKFKKLVASVQKPREYSYGDKKPVSL